MKPLQQSRFRRVSYGHDLAVFLEDLRCRIDCHVKLEQLHLFVTAIYIGLHHSHLILCQRSCLVRTYHCSRTHGLACMELADKVVFLQHPAHAQCKAHCNTHREAFRHRHDNERNSNHDRSKNEFGDLDETCAVGKASVQGIEKQSSDNDQRCYYEARGRYHPSELGQLLVERSLLACSLLRDRDSLALFRVHTDSRHAVYCHTFYHRSATQQKVRSICSVRIEIILHYGLVCIKLSCEV